MVLFAYRNQSAYNKLMFLFASKDFNQAYKRLKYLQQFATYRERQAASIQGKQNDLHIKIVELDKTKEQKHTLLVDQEKEKKTLGKQKNSQLEEVNNLSKQERQLLAQYQAKQRQRDRITRDIVRKIIEEDRRKQEEADRLAAAKAKASGIKDAPVVTKAPTRKTNSEISNSTPEAAKLSSDFLGNKGRLPWPVTMGDISRGFGPYTIEGISDDNTGIDIRTNTGSPIRAVFDGRVKSVNDVLGTFTIIVTHGEYLTVYGNLKSYNVTKDQKISTKQNIGTVATDGATGETEVHFEIYRAGVVVDPKYWLAPR
jgi:septal ring factor EnvC (AmiA/AmiB activator)